MKEIGVSNYGPSLLRKCRRRSWPRDGLARVGQIHYSLLARNKGNNQATVDAANELGIKPWRTTRWPWAC